MPQSIGRAAIGTAVPTAPIVPYDYKLPATLHVPFLRKGRSPPNPRAMGSDELISRWEESMGMFSRMYPVPEFFAWDERREWVREHNEALFEAYELGHGFMSHLGPKYAREPGALILKSQIIGHREAAVAGNFPLAEEFLARAHEIATKMGEGEPERVDGLKRNLARFRLEWPRLQTDQERQAAFRDLFALRPF